MRRNWHFGKKESQNFVKRVILLYANTRPKVANAKKQKVDFLDWEILGCPPYGPELSVCLFRPLKETHGGQQFDDTMWQNSRTFSGIF